MAKDVLITPTDGLIQFSSSAGTGSGTIQADGDNLVISNAIGDVLLGDGASDVFIGDGTNNVDIVFEQNGEIRDDGTGKSVTLGSSSSLIFITGSSSVTLQKDGGNVGIGSTVTDSLLHISGAVISDKLFHIEGSDGVDVVFVTGSGNVGVGTTDPNNPLSVSGSLTVFNLNETSRLTVGEADVSGESTSNSMIIETTGASNKSRIFTVGTSNDMVIETMGNNSDIHLSSDRDIRFGVNNNSAYNFTEKMIMKFDGKFGIGTSDPTETLEIGAGGRIKVTPGSDVTGSILSLANDHDVLLSSQNDSATGDPQQFVLQHNDGHTELINRRGNLILSSSADVNITAGGDDVIIQGADDVDILVQGGETAAKFSGNGGVDLYHNNVKKFSTDASGIDVAGNITASGTASIDYMNLGIAPDSSQRLTVKGDVLITGNLNNILTINAGGTGGGVSRTPSLKLSNNDTNWFIKNHGGNAQDAGNFRIIDDDATLFRIEKWNYPAAPGTISTSGSLDVGGLALGTDCHITASGNITSNGIISSSKVVFGQVGAGHISSSHSNLVGFETDSSTNKAWQLFAGNTAGQVKLYKNGNERIQINANDGATSYINNGGELAIGASSTINGATLGVTGNVSVSTHITASGNISSSGNISATGHISSSGATIHKIHQFSAGDDTPDVSGGTLFKTNGAAGSIPNPGAPHIITQFDGGTAGQIIHIFIQDNYTDFIHDASKLILFREADVTSLQTNDMISFVCLDGTIWYQLNSQDNS